MSLTINQRKEIVEAIQAWDSAPEEEVNLAGGKLARLLEERVEWSDSEHQLFVEFFNGFTANVSGNPEGVDKLVEEFVQNKFVRSIRVFDNAKGDYATKLNYTTLKEMRKA